MKNKKDIFDLFRDNEHKLDERPDGKLWDRLEGRLDQSSQPHIAPSRNGWKQWMSMAGVMLALIVVISVVNMMLKGGNSDLQRAENKGVLASLEMEEIGVFSDKGPNYTVAEYQKMLARLNTSPILEGDPNKKILIKNSVFVDLKQRSERQIALVDKILEVEESMSKQKTNKIETQKSSADQIAYADRVDTGVNYDTQVEENLTDSESDSRVATTYNGQAQVADAGTVVIEEVALTTASPAPPASTMNEDMMEMENVPDLNAASNVISVGATDDAQLGIQQFEWLLGKWEAPGTNIGQENLQMASSTAAKKSKRASAKKSKQESAEKMKEQKRSKDVASNRSVEEWKPLDEFTIEGQGYLVVNGDTTFTESMQIKKIDSDLYYILALDNSGKTVNYKLKTYTEQGAVFENESVAFPNQVILQKDVLNSNFTTLLQNKVPAQINSEQQQYFQNRNVIQSEQIRRVMNRVENE